MKKRKITMRLCTGCQEMKPKAELVRVVKNKENEVYVDLTGKGHGRGAYVCRNPVCLEKAKKNKKLEKALSSKISNEIYSELKSRLEDDND